MKFKRRNYFPEPKVQFRFLLILVVTSSIQIAAAWLILYTVLHQNFALHTATMPLDAETLSQMQREMNWVLLRIGGLFFLYLISLILLGIHFSHRVVGVIAALKRTIRLTLEGKQVELKLRNGDEFQELAESFNKLVAHLRSSNNPTRNNDRPNQ